MVLAKPVVLVIAGFGLLGVGIAVVVPLIFAAAGRIGAHRASDLADRLVRADPGSDDRDEFRCGCGTA
nr:hypothetical protein [uncultured Actinoplanes sp.]